MKKILKRNIVLKLCLAKGINLKSVPKTPRDENIKGISSTEFGDFWFNLPKGDAIFKTYGNTTWYEDADFRMLNEMFCSIAAKQIGVPCAEYDVAYLKNAKGLVTYNIAPKQKLYPFSRFVNGYERFHNTIILDLTFKNCIEIAKYAIDSYRAHIDLNQFALDLYKVMVFDTLFLITDRHAGNLAFLRNFNTFSLAPLFDHEFAFGGQRYLDYLMSSKSIPDGASMTMSQFKNSVLFKNSCLTYNYETSFSKRIENIIKLAAKKPEYMKFLKDCMQKLNVTQIFKEMNKKGLEFNSEYSKHVRAIVKSTAELINTRLQQIDEYNFDSINPT